MSAPKPSKPPTKEFVTVHTEVELTYATKEGRDYMVKLLEGRNQLRVDITGVGPDGHSAMKSVEGSAVVLKKEDK